MNSQDNKTQDPCFGRRQFLHGSSAAAASLFVSGTAVAGARRLHSSAGWATGQRHTLVCINMRGGADGLTLLAPVGASDYSTNRTNSGLGITNGDMLSSANFGNSYWRLPEALNPLKPIFDANHLAIVPAIGLAANNKSHFVAQDLMEFGTPPPIENPPSSITSGFIARHLMNGGFATTPALRGLVMQKRATTAFNEAPKSLAIANVQQFSFPGEPLMRRGIEIMHANEPDPLKAASENAFAAIDYLQNINFNTTVGNYPSTTFGDQMRRAAALILSGDAPEVIEIDIGGWDTHFNQGPNAGGDMFDLMRMVALSMQAFYADMRASNNLDCATVCTFTEFGRRIRENTSNGTDHGHGGVSFVMGGRVQGRVFDDEWAAAGGGATTSLANVDDGVGDVQGMHDIRDMFAELFVDLMGLNVNQLTNVYFSNFVHQPLGLVI